MARETRSLYDPLPPIDGSKWARRRDIPLALLAWVALIAIALWAASHIVRSLLLLVIAALLAFALAPLVRLLQRFIPRFLAIILVYIVVLSAISILLYMIVRTAVMETIALSRQIRSILETGIPANQNPLEQFLLTFGITREQIGTARQQLMAHSESLLAGSLPLLRSIFESIIDTVIVAVLSIYLLIDGSRAANWLRSNSPRIARASFLLDTLQRVVGGYIRGQFLLALLIGTLVGVGMFAIFRLPYAVFLGVLAFAMAFIPVLGTFISGAVCVLIALTKGWLVALGVLVYFVVVHVIEGELVGPRVVGKAVGLHPVISLFALVAGAELFGIWGALFASPLAGVLQALIIAVWFEWRRTHPEQFHQTEEQVATTIEDHLEDTPTSSIS